MPADIGRDGTLTPGSDETLPAASASLSNHAQLGVVEPDVYTDRSTLTQGGMGRIVTARDRRLGRTVAIKELRTQTEDLRARFEREALLTARLEHPGIVSVHEAGRWPSGEPFYAMKLVAGRPLDRVIADAKTLDARLALLPHVIAVADAIAYAHSKRVVHRDLKPHNVMVGDFGETVVIDWGLGKALDDAAEPAGGGAVRVIGDGAETAIGEVLGTPAYMPPEQAAGDAVDERADVYAIGAILYHVLAGAPPYAGKTSVELLDAVKRGPPTPLAERQAGVPPDLVAVVEKAMARRADDRFSSAGELVEALRRWQSGQLVGQHIYSYSTWQLIRRWLGRHRGLASAVAIAVVIAAAGAAWFLWREAHLRRSAEAAQADATEALRHETNQQLGVAMNLLQTNLHDLGAEADLVAANSDLQRALPNGPAAASDVLSQLDVASGLFQVFDVNGQPIASYAGANPGRFAGLEVDGAEVLKRARSLEQRVVVERVGDRLIMRAVAPVTNSSYELQGVVAITVPLDADFATSLQSSLGADVMIFAQGAPGVSSMSAPDGGSLQIPFPSGADIRGQPEAAQRTTIVGHEYSTAYGEVHDHSGRVIGILGVAIALGGQPVGARGSSELIVGRATDALSLDPAVATDQESADVIGEIYETLVDWRPGTTEVEPDLATSFTADRTGTVWTFTLRGGVRFQDGTSLDADAVVFSFERQRDPTNPYHRPDFQLWNNQFQYVEKVEKVDDHTVRFKLDRPHAPFLADLATYPVSIVSPTAVAKWRDAFGDHPVGTGPFRLGRWDKGKRITLERNPDYWRRDRVPAFDHLVFVAIDDARQRLIAVESGKVDVAESLRPDDLPFAENRPGLTLHRMQANNVAYLAMNTEHPPLDDIGVRRAIAHAINKGPIVQGAFQGMAIAADGPLPTIQWGYHATRATYPYDPEAARRLLADAGARGVWDPSRRLRLYIPSTPRPYLPDPDRIARVIQANLAEAGVEVEIVLQPFGDHARSTRNGEHDLCLSGWMGDNGDPDNYLQLFDSANAERGSALNVAFYRSPVVHGLLEWARESNDPAERSRFYAQVQEAIAEDVPWVPLAHAEIGVVARTDVDGLAIEPTGNIRYGRAFFTPARAP